MTTNSRQPQRGDGTDSRRRRQRPRRHHGVSRRDLGLTPKTVLLILLRFVGPLTAILISAIGWGVAHSLQVPIWGLTIWWPFLVLSTLFVTWRDRSLWAAFTLPMIAHALQNLPPALLVASGKAV